VRLYGLVSADTGSVVDFYATEEEAETVLAEAVGDEPEWAAVLRVEAVEFETNPN
jgi:hypothetical protein